MTATLRALTRDGRTLSPRTFATFGSGYLCAIELLEHRPVEVPDEAVRWLTLDDGAEPPTKAWGWSGSRWVEVEPWRVPQDSDTAR